MFRGFLHSLRSLLRKENLESELDEELRFHLEKQIEQNLERGMSFEEARRAALRAFGGVEQIKEDCRDMRGTKFIEEVWHDLRYGVRTMFKSSGFTLVAISALALGIGANTAIFSVIRTVLLSPLPYRAPERLVWVWGTNPVAGIKQETVSAPDFNDWRTESQSFEEMAGFTNTALTMTSESDPERIPGSVVTTNFFSLLGVEPLVGRQFSAEEHSQGNNRVVILGYNLWQRRFAGNPRIVGQSITLNGNPYQIVGVMPPGFKNPLPSQRNASELWIPLTLNLDPKERRSDFLSVVARLKPNATLEQTRAEMNTIARRLEQQYPNTNTGWSTIIIPLQERITGDVRPAMWVIAGVVGFLLLIACANVANLLLVRSAGRQQEIAVRRALGAGRYRLIRQFLTEGILLALTGGMLGALLGVWGMELLVRLSPVDIPRLDEIRLDWRVLLFTLAVSILTGIIFGLIPALHSTNPNLTESLKEGGRSSTGSLRVARLRNVLVVAEIAIALVLLVGAGLMIKSFARLQAVDPGFRPERILAVDISLPSTKYKEAPQQVAFWEQLLGRVSRLPGVERAAAVTALPLTGGSVLAFAVDGRPAPPAGQEPDAEYNVVTPDYFETMGITPVRGDIFTERHTAAEPAVTVINETMARRYFPGEDPIGKRINLGNPETSPWRTIIGVVKDIRQEALDTDPYPQMYSPYAQFPSRTMRLVVRTSATPSALVPLIRKEMSEMDKDQPLFNVRTMEQVLSESIARQRFNMLLIAIFAGLGLILAAVGIYGMVSYSVTQRTHEIGIRMALGASTRDVLKMVVKQAMILAFLGTGAGLVAAVLLTRLMSSLLYTVSATDPVTYILIPALLILTALAASLIPARRATRVDPMIALRYE